MTHLEKLRVGVVGVGFIGELHARIFSEIPTADLVAVMKALGCPGGKLAGVSSYRISCYNPSWRSLDY